MSVYEIDTLMTETRRLAAQYYQTTRQSLPVSHEIARYDAVRLLSLTEPPEPQKGVDAYQPDQTPVQIKGRVIFDESKSNYRIGQLNQDGLWQKVLLVIMNPDYHTEAIYVATRDAIDAANQDTQNPKRNKRGAMSVAKFKAIGELIWTNE